MKKRILFYCQPMLGMGHFIRSREIIRGLRDFEVCFLYGAELVAGLGSPSWPSGVDVVRLPAIKSDAEFKGLYVADGSQSLAEAQEIRKELILSTYDRVRPDILVTELFPFGRRRFAFELLPLIERAHGYAKIVCSLRDILVAKRNHDRFEKEVCDLVNRRFDMVLVHSDPRFQRLEETFYRRQEIERPVVYTGFVAAEPEPENIETAVDLPPSESAFILVSAGGGRVGYELLECSIAAGIELEGRLDYRMRIVTGPHIPEEGFLRLRRLAARAPRIAIEAYTARFFQLLKRADLSVSMAGYNTCMDLLRAGARALVYPFTGGGNQEQMIRARKLEKLGAVSVIDPLDLTPERLAEKIIQSLNQPRPAPSATLDLKGVERTAEALAELVN
ncbi:MAG: glycosyltransferase family protein [Blastocatellia bacterium]